MGDHRAGARPLTDAEDMAFVACSGGDARRLAYLRAHPEQARTIGRAIARMVEGMRAAYPGRTRDRFHDNESWRAAGYPEIAEENALLGFSGR